MRETSYISRSEYEDPFYNLSRRSPYTFIRFLLFYICAIDYKSLKYFTTQKFGMGMCLQGHTNTHGF